MEHFLQVGEKFRIRALKFPGLLAGCTIDWFLRWPKDALYEVGEHFLEKYKVICSMEVKTQLMMIVGDIQDYMNDVCVDYFNRSARLIDVVSILRLCVKRSRWSDFCKYPIDSAVKYT